MLSTHSILFFLTAIGCGSTPKDDTAASIQSDPTPCPTEDTAPEPTSEVFASTHTEDVCDAGDEFVVTINTIAFDNDAEIITITDLLIEGEGWEIVSAPTLPTEAPAGFSFDVTVKSSGVGAGSLVANGYSTVRGYTRYQTYTVGLQANVNGAPEIVSTHPQEGIVLASGNNTVYSTVYDDDDGDIIEWVVDGNTVINEVLGQDPFKVTFDAGDHDAVVTVTDPCGHTDSVSFSFCQQGGYDAATLDIGQWKITGAGTTFWDSANNRLQITDNSAYQAGAAFPDIKTRADDIDISFKFYVGGGSGGGDETGGDGFALVVLKADGVDWNNPTTFRGCTGYGIGYGSGGETECTGGFDGLPGWAIEFDTVYNPGIDPSEYSGSDHIAFTVNGDPANHILKSAPISPSLYVGTTTNPTGSDWKTMRVILKNRHLTVSVEGITVVEGDVDQSIDLNYDAYVGFSGSTGAYTDFHLIESLTVEQKVCEE